MKHTDKKRSKTQVTLLTFSVLLILSGVWFSGTNAYKFIKGYLLFKTSEAYADNHEKAFVERDHKSTSKKTNEPFYPIRPKQGENIGNLFIPKLEAKLPIFHGTDEEELDKGVGHFSRSVLPGEKDNSVLSGHRDSVFRRLGDVGKGDLLVVETSAGKFTYKVRNVRIVDKDDRTVIVPKPRATLTVSTCYPFHFIGAAPQRYILVANLVSQELTK
ncbi:class D sortase [Fictibacillus barbaricus]|uniref:Sortase A n=1 Tax=Fictibacillus barbaricus TaxID=182136 RepID=A0ABU1TYX2_9BACL|nr:class D sortase [Fictibacillus barbaricus]MDR7072409.1 sortase A [Fictibacillus barbaricus]